MNLSNSHTSGNVGSIYYLRCVYSPTASLWKCDFLHSCALCISWQNFNCYNVSRNASAIAEILLTVYRSWYSPKKLKISENGVYIQKLGKLFQFKIFLTGRLLTPPRQISPHWCNMSPLREKTQNRPLSNLNTSVPKRSLTVKTSHFFATGGMRNPNTIKLGTVIQEDRTIFVSQKCIRIRRMISLIGRGAKYFGGKYAPR